MTNAKIKSFFKKYYLLIILLGITLIALQQGGYLSLGAITGADMLNCSISGMYNNIPMYKCDTAKYLTANPYDNGAVKIIGNKTTSQTVLVSNIPTSGGLYSFSAGCPYKEADCSTLAGDITIKSTMWCKLYAGLTKNCAIYTTTYSLQTASKYYFISTPICGATASPPTPTKKCLDSTTITYCIREGSEWGSNVKCSAEQVCENAVCIDKPLVCDEKPLGTYQCSGKDRQERYVGTDCKTEEWKTIGTCEDKCVDGECVLTTTITPQQASEQEQTPLTEEQILQQEKVLEQAAEEDKEVASECVSNKDCGKTTTCLGEMSNVCDDGVCKPPEVSESECPFDVRPFLEKYGLILGGVISAIGIIGALLYVRKKGA